MNIQITCLYIPIGNNELFVVLKLMQTVDNKLLCNFFSLTVHPKRIIRFVNFVNLRFKRRQTEVLEWVVTLIRLKAPLKKVDSKKDSNHSLRQTKVHFTCKQVGGTIRNKMRLTRNVVKTLVEICRFKNPKFFLMKPDRRLKQSEAE